MSWLLTLFAPIIGGFLYGIERKLKARMQSRKGPPIMQPFYDLFKLTDKRPMILHSYHAFMGIMHFVAAWVALSVLFFGGDLLVAIFFHLLSTSLLIVAGYSAQSTYSRIGATRELIAIAALEPVLILTAIAFYLHTGSFEVSKILGTPSTFSHSFIGFLALLIALPGLLKKSPFDAAEAHQEIVGGAEIEFSGIFYEAVYTAKWLDMLFVFTLVFLFGGANFALGAALALIAFFVVLLADNSTARVKYQDLVKIVYKFAFALAAFNIILGVLS
ncbi:MAG: NADH-quinone oxidoreductase subunit H [Campylobacterales bacterium]